MKESIAGELFYWNKLHLDDNRAREQLAGINNHIEIWSYNRYDCEKFDLNFNSTMYEISSIFALSKNASPIRDVFFGGWSTNERLIELDHVLEEFAKYNISYYVDTAVVGKSTYKPMYFDIKEKCLEYSDYINELCNSKAVLNLDKYPNMGCSLRAIEALGYKKKYITNNRDIKKEPLYDKDNVFILGEDNIEELKSFLKRPYKEMPEGILNFYSISQWIDRFDSDM